MFNYQQTYAKNKRPTGLNGAPKDHSPYGVPEPMNFTIQVESFMDIIIMPLVFLSSVWK